jgi:hypothetical protein
MIRLTDKMGNIRIFSFWFLRGRAFTLSDSGYIPFRAFFFLFSHS